MGRKLLTMLSLVSLILITVLMLLPVNSEAESVFSRVYGVDCSYCHKNIPEINQRGFEFRSAGYRMPNEIGKSLPTKGYSLSNYLGMGAMMGAQLKDHADTSATGGASAGYDTLGFEATEFDLWPMIGAWGNNFGSEVKLAFTVAANGTTTTSIQTAFARAAWGDEKGWFHAKAGTLIQESYSPSFAAGNAQPSFANSIYGLDIAAPSSGPGLGFGVDLGYYFATTSTDLDLIIADGFARVSGQEGALGGITSFSGFYSHYGDGFTANNRPSFALELTQFLDNQNSAISFIWYNGLVNNVNSGTANTYINDTANRVQLSWTYTIMPVLSFGGSLMYGDDSLKGSGTSALAYTDVGYYGGYAQIKYKNSFYDAFAISAGLSKPTDVPGSTHTNISKILIGHTHLFGSFALLNTAITYTNTQQVAGGNKKDTVLSSTLKLYM